jgi:tetratricopeptide (TPR) repeat protein
MARRKSRHSPGDLPQQPETWHVAVRQLRIWITPPDEEPSRPFVALIFSLDTGVLQKLEVVQGYPTPQHMLEILFQATRESPQGVDQQPHRPTTIQFEDASMAEALAPELEKIGVGTQHYLLTEVVDELVHDLELYMRGGPELPGLLSTQGVTPDLAGGMFAAAAEFYRAAPWMHLTDQQILAVRVAPERKARFAQVLGYGGVEYGLAMYRRWGDVERMFDFVDGPLELLPPGGGHLFSFDELSQVPFDDLEAIEQYGWEVAEADAYPIAVILTRQEEAKRPSRADLIWYEAALRAIAIFARDHLQSDERGDYQPADTTLSVPTHAGETKVHIKYPAGTLPTETRPVQMTEWPQLEEETDEDAFPAFDRRAMEEMMAGFGEGFDDPGLQEAQDLMYQAWGESNPARRIILAHEALSISPDCTDAYVLLAEEEADTVRRALEYYQQGVKAGERALGEAYFEENEGHFWGLLETRPYMRARQGLANTLWELGREEETLAHFRDLLRLNPNDNQGVRYSLLNLLLRLNRDAEAQELLQQYQDDAMAEWLYTRALLAFRTGGASQAAERALREALEMNSHVPAYLTGRKRIPSRRPDYIALGQESEATAYASSYLPLWRKTPGAVDWLRQSPPSSGTESHRKPSMDAKRKGAKKRQRKGRKKR